MSKIIKTSLPYFAIVLTWTLQLYYQPYLKIGSGTINSFTTFLSIIFGFYITSLSLFATSSFVKTLYKKDDKDDKSITLLDTLINKYKRGLIVSLISIFYCLILQGTIDQNDPNNQYVYLNNTGIVLIPLFIYNIIYGYLMLGILIKVIKQEAKISK